MRVCLLLLFLLLPFQCLGVVFQAEDADELARCDILRRHQGYQGSGYADYRGTGSFVVWNVDVPSTGTHFVSIRYASRTNRPLDLLVDGASKPLFQLDPRVTGIFGTSRPSLCTWNRDRMRSRCLLQRALDPTLIGCQ